MTRARAACCLALLAAVDLASIAPRAGAATEGADSARAADAAAPAADAMSAAKAAAELSTMPVSRLEWGMLRLERYLDEQFALDPTTLAPYEPPFFINLKYDADTPRLVIEIGRTFSELDADRAAPLCREYVNRVRILFNVDKVGRPIAAPHSALARDYFLPLSAPEVDARFAHAIDRLVYVQGLVASPLSGAYAVCGAGIRDAEVRFLD